MLIKSPATEYMIDTESLSKRFPPRRSFLGRRSGRDGKLAVDGVTMRIAPGEIFGLVGPNGAGKTTFIRMLCTLLLPTSGRAMVGGYDVRTQDAQVRQFVGLVSSNERSFYWRLTGRQNLEFFADLYHLPRQERRAWMNELLDLLDLTRIADQRFDQYSTGQKQRIAIARGLLSRPKVLLMDEPTKGVDPVGAAKLVTMIRERIVSLWNPTILVTSHNLNEIERLCGRIAMMAGGRLIALGRLEELRALIAAANTYRLTVRHLIEHDLQALARAAGAMSDARLDRRNGTIAMELSLPRDSDGFPRLIRGIVDNGGDVVSCTTVEASIEDVFHTLVARNQPAALAADEE